MCRAFGVQSKQEVVAVVVFKEHHNNNTLTLVGCFVFFRCKRKINKTNEDHAYAVPPPRFFDEEARRGPHHYAYKQYPTSIPYQIGTLRIQHPHTPQHRATKGC